MEKSHTKPKYTNFLKISKSYNPLILHLVSEARGVGGPLQSAASKRILLLTSGEYFLCGNWVSHGWSSRRVLSKDPSPP